MKPIYILLLLLCAGCGTIMRPVIKDKEGLDMQIYPGTRFDAKLIGYAAIGQSLLGLDTDYAGVGLNRVVWSSTQIFCGLLDLPISLVTDTVCFPYDLWTWKEVK